MPRRRKAKPSPRLPLLSLPLEIQIEILSYLNFDEQISASTVCKHWASLFLTSRVLQLPRRAQEPHITTQCPGFPLILDGGPRGDYIRTKTPHGTFDTYFFSRNAERESLRVRAESACKTPCAGRDLTDNPLLGDLLFPPVDLKFYIDNFLKTSEGQLALSKPLTPATKGQLTRKYHPLQVTYLLLDRDNALKPEIGYRERVHRIPVAGERHRSMRFSIYKDVTVSDFLTVGMDMLWDLKRQGLLVKTDGQFVFLVEV